MAARSSDLFSNVSKVYKYAFARHFKYQSVRYSTSTLKTETDKTEIAETDGENEFRRLELYGRKHAVDRKKRQTIKTQLLPPRYTKMSVDQDWANVWPTAHSFKPSVVPLPLRQGYNEKGPAPGKFGNAELMKIPNFLHLTPPAIRKHCAAIRQFCTPWPEELKTDEDCEKHFPLLVHTYDYCHSGPSIRDPKARIVNIQIKLGNLNLDKHARDKLLRLVDDRYNKNTDVLTIVTDRCPLKKQNYDYGIYLLTVLYHQSWKVEPWESEKEESDMEEYVWEGSKSQQTLVHLIQEMKKVDSGNGEISDSCYLKSLQQDCSKEDIVKLDIVKQYSDIVTEIHNHGEDEYKLNKYKESVMRLFHLS